MAGIAGILILHLLLLFKLKFTAWPEMLLWPYLILKGWLPYVNIAIAHTPHLIIDLAVFYKFFGAGILQLKIFTWILILITDLLIYRLTAKIWSKKIALISLISFVIWSLFFDGNGLWFDLMLAPFAIASYFLLTKKHYFWTGVLWGIMFFTKQTAVWFLIPMGLMILPEKKNIIRLTANVISGAATITVIWVLVLWIWGVLPGFYNWAINFGIFILPKAQGQIQWPDMKNLAVALFPFLVFIPLVLKNREKNFNLLIWAIAGALGAYPRFEYFHFQPAIPFLAIASALVFYEIKKYKGPLKIFLAFYIIGSLYLFGNFFIRNFAEGTRFFETDVSDVAAYVKDNAKPGDRIFVMNWWDNIYALSDTIPAVNPWVPQLSWYQELSGIQETELKNLVTDKPRMIIFQDYSDSGLASYVPQKVFDFVRANYHLKEKIDGIEILTLK